MSPNRKGPTLGRIASGSSLPEEAGKIEAGGSLTSTTTRKNLFIIHRILHDASRASISTSLGDGDVAVSVC